MILPLRHRAGLVIREVIIVAIYCTASRRATGKTTISAYSFTSICCGFVAQQIRNKRGDDVCEYNVRELHRRRMVIREVMIVAIYTIYTVASSLFIKLMKNLMYVHSACRQ